MRLPHRLQGQKSRSRGVGILWRPPSRTACYYTNICQVHNYAIKLNQKLLACHSGRTSVFDRRTFPVLRSTCIWRVTTYVGKLSGSVHTTLHSPPLHYSKTSTGYPLNGEYISNWPPWRIRHCTLASHLTCPNCYNIMNPHGLCDLPLLFNSLYHDTTLNLARMHLESRHQKSGIYCLLVSVGI